MNSQKIRTNVRLAAYTSFGVGGVAENLFEPSNTEALVDFLQNNKIEPIWLLGYGSNTLISDKGLPGLTILLKGGTIEVEDSLVIADAGVWWDDVVQTAIDNDLWGIENLSEVPGSVGAAIFINIAAYGQSIGPVVEWVEVWNSDKQQIVRIQKNELRWSYKESIFQDEKMKHAIILRAALRLTRNSPSKLEYQKAIDVAEELSLDAYNINDRRKIIIEARRRAGSLWKPGDTSTHTAGSFFKNKSVDAQLAEKIIRFDESGKTADQIKKMNQTHAGDSRKVSAAHILLAAGFHRGQRWDNVKLHDDNLLKIEALEGASAQNIYDAMKHIQETVMNELGIKLEAEVRLLGDFS